MDRAAGAGFYSDEFGFLPWSFGTGVVDAFDRWRLGPAPATGATQITSVERKAPTSSQE